MDRFLKWFPLFFLVVLIVMAATAYWYVTPQRLKAIVQPYLSLALKRDVTFDRINWRLSEGVVISGLRVAGEVGADPILVAERAQVQVSPSAWFLGTGWLGELVLADVVVVVAKRDWEESDGSPIHAGAEGPVSNTVLPIDRVRVQNGVLRVENYPQGRITVVSGINGRGRGLKRDGRFVFDSDFSATQVATWANRDTVMVRGLHMSGQVLPWNDLDVSVRAENGVWAGVALHNMAMALRAEGGRFHVKQIRGQVFEGTLSGALVWDNSAWNGSVSLANARAEQVVHAMGWNFPLYGAVDITAQVSGAGVQGTARMATGRIVKWAFLQRTLPPMAKWVLPRNNIIPLKNVAVVFKMQGDEMILDGTKFTAADMACRASGKSTRQGRLNYVLDVAMPLRFAGFRLGRRTIPVRVKITGTTRAPQVTAKMQ